MAERKGEEMRIEIKERPRKENVLEVWLEREQGGDIVLYADNGSGRRSIAFFNQVGKAFHVFDYDVRHFGLSLTSGGDAL